MYWGAMQLGVAVTVYKEAVRWSNMQVRCTGVHCSEVLQWQCTRSLCTGQLCNVLGAGEVLSQILRYQRVWSWGTFEGNDFVHHGQQESMTRGLQSQSRVFESVIACELQAAVTVCQMLWTREAMVIVGTSCWNIQSVKQGVFPCVMKQKNDDQKN